jgi:hypothetical protein
VGVVGDDALDVGAVSGFPVAGIAGDHALVVEKMQFFPSGPFLLSRLQVQTWESGPCREEQARTGGDDLPPAAVRDTRAGTAAGEGAPT